MSPVAVTWDLQIMNIYVQNVAPKEIQEDQYNETRTTKSVTGRPAQGSPLPELMAFAT